MTRRLKILLPFLVLGLLLAPVSLLSEDVIVASVADLRAALLDPTPGRTYLIAPGIYERTSGGFSSNTGILRGTEAQPIIFRALDPGNKPEIRGGMYLPGMAWVTFDGLHLTRPGAHGMNLDDSDHRDDTHHISLLNMHYESTADKTAFANIKMARLDDVRIDGCLFEGWGDEAIDFVGVHGGKIINNRFIGVPGFFQRMAIQLKGGTWDIEVANNFILNAGGRGIQAGGGSSETNSRPQSPPFEAERINVWGNIIVRSKACWVASTQTGSRFHHNICYLPTTWIMRVLQENGFSQPNQNATVDHNLFVYSGAMGNEFVNVGPGTAVETFIFDNNAYWQVDGDSPVPPNLPVAETNTIDQVDPELINSGTRTMRIGSSSAVFGGIGTPSGPASVASWQITAGQMPDGLTLNGATGAISGIPSAAGEFTFTVSGAGLIGSAVREYTVTIAAAVVVIAVAPDELPDGRVGEPYTALLSLDVAQ